MYVLVAHLELCVSLNLCIARSLSNLLSIHIFINIYNPSCFFTAIKRGGNQGRVYYNGCPSQQDNDELVLDVLKFLSIEFGVIPLGLARTYAATSCEQIASANPQSKAGMYWITNDTTRQQEYCSF